MNTPHRPLFTQRDLFQSRPTRPLWRSLPPEVRSRVMDLLIQLLREHQNARAAAPHGKEAGHE
jgi:hypothetical protein